MNYSKWARILAVAPALVSCAALGTQATAAENPFTASLWDDGKAEFSLYTGVTRRYGQPRPTRARIIVVKEDLVRATLVKSDAGPVPGKTLVAIKLNFLAEFPTGTYDYHQMATVMFERATLDVLKETMTHSESCGITFVRVGPKGGKLVQEAHSYWDGEADREVEVRWPAGERLYWDALPVSLRTWIAGEKPPLRRRVWLMPSQVSGQAPLSNARPAEATITMTDGGTLAVPAGRFASRKFEVTTAQGTDALWFDARAPHVLLRLDTQAGRRLELEKTMRLDYWNHHAIGDEKLLF